MSHMNSRYSKILIGLDGSDDSIKAADDAIAIAKLHGAKLITVHVIPSRPTRSFIFQNMQNDQLKLQRLGLEK